MKQLLLITLLSFSANAKITEEEMKYCAQLEKAAGLTMQARQNGDSMRELIEKAGESKVLVSLIRDAYNTTRYHTESSKKRAIESFKNDTYMLCYSEFSKGESK